MECSKIYEHIRAVSCSPDDENKPIEISCCHDINPQRYGAILIDTNGHLIAMLDRSRYDGLPKYKKLICKIFPKYKQKFIDVVPVEFETKISSIREFEELTKNSTKITI